MNADKRIWFSFSYRRCSENTGQVIETATPPGRRAKGESRGRRCRPLSSFRVAGWPAMSGLSAFIGGEYWIFSLLTSPWQVCSREWTRSRYSTGLAAASFQGTLRRSLDQASLPWSSMLTRRTSPAWGDLASAAASALTTTRHWYLSGTSQEGFESTSVPSFSTL